MNSNIQFEAIGEDFKKIPFDNVLAQIKDKVEEFAPDIILLDFRLMEDHDADASFDKISGSIALKNLKGDFQNPGMAYGTQILIFTATSRIENILRLKALNADGFILKEKADQYATKEITRDLISRVIRLMDEALQRSKLLIPLNQALNSINQEFTRALTVNSADAIAVKKEEIRMISESIRVTTQGNQLSEGILKLVYLQLMNILEVCTRHLNLTSLNAKVNTMGAAIGMPAAQLNKEWKTLCTLRNCVAHGLKYKNRPVINTDLYNGISHLLPFINRFVELSLSNPQA